MLDHTQLSGTQPTPAQVTNFSIGCFLHYHLPNYNLILGNLFTIPQKTLRIISRI